MNNAAWRNEHDLLGDHAVPQDAYYGVHTVRAVENFPITGTSISIYPDLIYALACVKQAAALANNELGTLQPVAAGANNNRAALLAVCTVMKCRHIIT